MLNNKKSNWLHVAISWGASIVILGAMFKINHLAGQFGTYMIGLGLSVEAALFFILGFFPPAQDPEWERVYPELAADYQGALPNPALKSGQGNIAALDKLLAQADVTPEGINNLGEGLKKFGDKLARINSVTDATLATNEFSDKIKIAAGKYDLLGIAFERATAGLNALASDSVNSGAYQQQITKLTHNLAQLNSLYETELNGADNNLRQVNHFYKGLNAALQSMHESADDTRQFKDEINKLSKNISSLNVFYANMLAAMNQPRM